MPNSRSSPSDKGHKLYVGGLLESVHKEDITREFNKFGDLQDVWVARNPPGFAFVEFTKAVDAERAVRALDGMNVCGSRIRVEFAHGRGGGGGGGNRNGSGGGPRGGRGGMRGPRSPPPQRRFGGSRSSPPPLRRGRSPPPILGGVGGSLAPAMGGRFPYDSLAAPSASLYHPDPLAAAAAAAAAAFPYGLPGYPPLLPFLPPEEILRSLQQQQQQSSLSGRRRSPLPAYGRRRSRSPIGRLPPRGRSPYSGSRDRFSPPGGGAGSGPYSFGGGGGYREGSTGGNRRGSSRERNRRR